MWLCWRTRALSTAPSGSRSASNAVRPCLTVRPGLSRGPQTLLPSGFRHPQSPGPTGSPIRYASMVQLRPLGGADSVQCALSRGGLVTPRLARSSLYAFPVEVSAPHWATGDPQPRLSLWLDPGLMPFLLGNRPCVLWKPNLQSRPSVRPTPLFLVGIFFYKAARLFCCPACPWQELLDPMAPNNPLSRQLQICPQQLLLSNPNNMVLSIRLLPLG